MSSGGNLLSLIGARALFDAANAEALDADPETPLPEIGKNAIEDLYFLAGHCQELQALNKKMQETGALVRERGSDLQDEELVLMLCLSLAEHVRKHPHTERLRTAGGSTLH